MNAKEVSKTVLYALSLAMGVSGSTLLFAEGTPFLALLGIGVACLAVAGLVDNK